ncbi:MAG: malic enzyme-like NAD(P)-binding protein [Nocardioidaceae bacterium]
MVTGSLKEAVRGADVFIGVSAPDVLDAEDIAAMVSDAVVFALANPDPEVDPAVAREHAAVVATGRSDYPNQINNVLAFPGVFRGLLDAAATTIESPLLVAAARAIASTVSDTELNANYVIPSVFQEDVHKAVAAAVRDAVSGQRLRSRQETRQRREWST